jgi:molecular chaperone Hsp33
MSSSDRIARCLLPTLSVRAVAAITTETAREAARRHQATGGAAAALGRATTAAALLATLTKDMERVTLQIMGDGPLGAITVDASSNGNLRAFLKHPAVMVPAAPDRRVTLGAFVGASGVLGLVRDLGLKEHFSGQTALVDGEIDTDVEHYLVASEQIDSAIACETLLGEDLAVRVSAGVLLQALPGTEGAPLLEMARHRLREGLLTELLAADGTTSTPESLVRAVVGSGVEVKVLDARPLRFHCACSRERAANTLALVGAKEMEELVEEDGGAHVVCEFCREKYRFTREEIAEILRAGS